MTGNSLQLFGASAFDRIDRAIADVAAGKGVLIVDDENRENEGDLIFSAEKITTRDMALMIRHCSGIVCLCIPGEKAEQLHLGYMVEDNTSRFQTAFTVSIEAKEGVTTGVSAADRVQTIKTAINDKAKPQHLARPGHVFPLIASDNGVLARRGHTEGSVDLMKLAGLNSTAVLCELMNDDGTMAKFDQVIAFALKQEITVICIEDIVQYRKRSEGVAIFADLQRCHSSN